MTTAAAQALPFYGDDVEPYKSATPSTYRAVVGDWPTVNYHDPFLVVKIVVLVSSTKYYSELSSANGGMVVRSILSSPGVGLNTVLEICGTVEDLRNERFDQVSRRVLCDNIYHRFRPPESITNPPRIDALSNPPATTTSTPSLPPANQQWTNDDVARLLCHHWNAARQYSLTAKLTHDDGVELIGYYDAIPAFSPPPFGKWYREGHFLMFGTLVIASSITSSRINFLIPTAPTSTLSNNNNAHITSFNLNVAGCHIADISVLPTIGDCVLLISTGSGSIIGYQPLLSPSQDSMTPPSQSPPSSSSAAAPAAPTQFTAEMFQKSSYMTDLVLNTTLLKLVNHHHKLCIPAQKYTVTKLPPRRECIDITPYLDIADPAGLQKEQERLEKEKQEKLRKEKEEKQRQEEEQRQRQQSRQRQQYQQRVQKIQSDTQFIHDLMGYHRNVTILPTAQKIIQQHPFLLDYITTQITTPFQQYQQEMHDYLAEHYSQEKLNTPITNTRTTTTTTTTTAITSKSTTTIESESNHDHTNDDGRHQQSNIYNINDLPPSPLESLMYHDYKDFIQGVQSTLFTLSSSSSTSPFLELLLSTNDDDTNKAGSTTTMAHINNGSDFAMLDNDHNDATTQATTSLLQLQPPHIYHHAHTTDAHRVEAIQRQYQRLLLATSRDLPSSSSSTTTTTTLPSITSTFPAQQQLASLSTTNHSLNDMLKDVDPVINYLLSNENPTSRTSQAGTIQRRELDQEQLYPPHQPHRQQHDHIRHQHYKLSVSNETWQELFINAKQQNDELLGKNNNDNNNNNNDNDENNNHDEEPLPTTPTADINQISLLQSQIQQLQKQLQDTREDFKQQLEAKDGQLATKDNQLATKDKQLEQQLAAKDKQIQQLMELVVSMNNSRA